MVDANDLSYKLVVSDTDLSVAFSLGPAALCCTIINIPVRTWHILSCAQPR